MIELSKLTKLLKNNINFLLGIILGGILFGGVTYVIATEIASSNITYTGNGQSNVKGALDNLYTKADKWGYKYWRETTSYTPTTAPATVYTNYTNSGVIGSNTVRAFIRTTYANGSPVRHAACLYINPKALCINSYFYADSGGTCSGTLQALRQEMQNAFSSVGTVSCSNCSSTTAIAECGITAYSTGKKYNFMIYNNGASDAVINAGSDECVVNSSMARCYGS